jgi:hypothetical protein
MRNDPIEITARFDSVCCEKGTTIKKGDKCIYYPIGKKIYCMDSKQAYEYRNWRMDLAMGNNY